MMNREQRRKYAKQIKNNKAACICPECKNRARFISMKHEGEETAIVCEVCGKTVRQSAAVTKAVPPGIYLPVNLDIFDTIVTAQQSIDEEEEKENVLEGNEDCSDEGSTEATCGA